MVKMANNYCASAHGCRKWALHVQVFNLHVGRSPSTLKQSIVNRRGGEGLASQTTKACTRGIQYKVYSVYRA